MLLTLFAILIGSFIGRIRGGAWSGVARVELRSTPFLVVAISTMLVQAVLNPIFPFLWSFIGVVSLIVFAARNRHLTGMTVLLIGATLNLLPLLLNFATPVSELALTSVGDVDAFGFPDIDGARESSSTATRLSFLGDAVPVPLFGSVVSIGDLIVLVGLGDIFTNLLLRERSRELELDDAGVSFAAHAAEKPASAAQSRSDKVSILSPLQTNDRQTAHRAQRQKAAPSSHVPAHAAPEVGFQEPVVDQAPTSDHVPAHAAEPVPVELRDEPIIITLDDLANQEDAAPSHAEPVVEALSAPVIDLVEVPNIEPIDNDVTAAALSGARANAIAVTPSAAPAPVVDAVTETIDLTDPDDPRPIIDLTKSPTDAQMTEFLRRRRSADRDHARVAVRPAGQRRGRAPVRISSDDNVEVAEGSI